MWCSLQTCSISFVICTCFIFVYYFWWPMTFTPPYQKSWRSKHTSVCQFLLKLKKYEHKMNNKISVFLCLIRLVSLSYIFHLKYFSLTFLPLYKPRLQWSAVKGSTKQLGGGIPSRCQSQDRSCWSGVSWVFRLHHAGLCPPCGMHLSLLGLSRRCRLDWAGVSWVCD